MLKSFFTYHYYLQYAVYVVCGSPKISTVTFFLLLNFKERHKMLLHRSNGFFERLCLQNVLALLACFFALNDHLSDVFLEGLSIFLFGTIVVLCNNVGEFLGKLDGWCAQAFTYLLN